MDSTLLSLFVVAGVGALLLAIMFILPQRKLLEEKERNPLYEERCSASWRFAHGTVMAGGNIPIARISFYEDFFVIAMGAPMKVFYSEVLSVDFNFKKSRLSKMITFHFAKGRSLLVHPRNFEKMLSLIEVSGIKAVEISGKRSVSLN